MDAKHMFFFALSVREHRAVVVQCFDDIAIPKNALNTGRNWLCPYGTVYFEGKSESDKFSTCNEFFTWLREHEFPYDTDGENLFRFVGLLTDEQAVLYKMRWL